jgi:predicted PurR-regulated permease PerM
MDDIEKSEQAVDHATEDSSRAVEETTKKELTLQAVTLPVLVIAAGTAFLYYAGPILIPLVTAAALAYLLIPGVKFLKKQLKLPHTLAVMVVMTIVLGLFVLLGFVLVNEVTQFAQSFPELKVQALDKVKEWNSTVADSLGYKPQELLNTDSLMVAPGQIKSIGGYLLKGISSVTNFILGMVVLFFLTLFILLDSEMLSRKLKSIFGESQSQTTESIIEEVNSQLRSFVQTRFYILIGFSVVVTVALLIFGVQYAYIWGPLAGFLNLIPYIGSIAGSIPPIIVAGIQYNSIMMMVWVALFFLVLQMIEGNLITPKITSNSVDLNSVTTLVSLSYWGWIWGGIGLLLAIPITATIKVICDHIEPLKPIGLMMGAERKAK